jgi:hypothetical protein
MADESPSLEVRVFPVAVKQSGHLSANGDLLGASMYPDSRAFRGEGGLGTAAR